MAQGNRKQIIVNKNQLALIEKFYFKHSYRDKAQLTHSQQQNC
jgi:hypothetical protein